MLFPLMTPNRLRFFEGFFHHWISSIIEEFTICCWTVLSDYNHLSFILQRLQLLRCLGVEVCPPGPGRPLNFLSGSIAPELSVARFNSYLIEVSSLHQITRCEMWIEYLKGFSNWSITSWRCDFNSKPFPRPNTGHGIGLFGISKPFPRPNIGRRIGLLGIWHRCIHDLRRNFWSWRSF